MCLPPLGPHGQMECETEQVLSKVTWEECVATPQGIHPSPQINCQNCPFPFDDHHPYLIHPSLDRQHSPPQTASGRNQPFCHNTLSRQTDRQIHGISDRSIPIALMLYYIDSQRQIICNTSLNGEKQINMNKEVKAI